MGCLFLLFAGAFPRIGSILIWLARPNLFEAAFGGAWIWPVLGIVFLPFTTLMYVLLWSPTGLAGFDWFWLILAVLIDLGQLGGSGYANRNRVPGYASTRPATP